jgi:Short C-terminal domain
MPRGGFGGGFGRGYDHGFGMRRYGAPLIMPYGGYGYGMGMGMGSPLVSTLMAGGLGYALGSNSAQQVPAYPQPYLYPYQAPPAAPQSPPAASQGQAAGADSGTLARLKLLGELHDSGVLTDDEFERQKQKILGG